MAGAPGRAARPHPAACEQRTGRARVDLSLERTMGSWSLVAAVGNVFDRPFYGTVCDPRSIVRCCRGAASH